MVVLEMMSNDAHDVSTLRKGIRCAWGSLAHANLVSMRGIGLMRFLF